MIPTRSLPLLLSLVAFNMALAQDSTQPQPEVLPKADPVFKGIIARTAQESKANFPLPIKAPKGAPNILLVMTDDVGFGASSTFGGEVPTPTLDALALHGLRYNAFHTTAMCSPSRAALLTGRNAHAVGHGIVVDVPSGYPGYSGIIPHDTVSIARVLRDNGYSTAMFGKHHNVARLQNSQAGPFNQWPSALGFDYFYGFIGAATSQFHPKLYRNTQPAAPSSDPNYILDQDLADDAIQWIHNQKAAAQDKPFFVYYAPGTAHAPHQAPSEWIAKFKGKFEVGWDKVRDDIYARQKAQGIIPADAKLNPRPAEIPPWDSLSATQKKVYARLMEVFAGMLAYQDYQFGRIIGELKRMGQYDNTLIVFIQGDNGATGEGGMDGNLNEMGHLANRYEESIEEMAQHLDEIGGPKLAGVYPMGWAQTMNTPFQWLKQIASHLGGIRNGLVVTWPQRIKARGEIRSQFHHLNDIAPTLLELTGIKAPTVVDGVAQQAMDGVSMAYTFDNAQAPDRHTSQYFELLGNRSIYQNGWMANTKPLRLPFELSPRPGDYQWEIYNLRKDYSQSQDLAQQEPERLQAMQALWWKEAERNKVLPVDNDLQSRDRTATQVTMRAARSNKYEYWGSGISVYQDSAPFMASRPFTLTAHIDVPQKNSSGVIVANGSRFGGWSFFLKDGKPTVIHAFSHRQSETYRIAGQEALPPGPATLRFDFDYDGGGMRKGGVMRISVDGKEVALGRIDKTVVVTAGIGETFDIGRDTGDTVTDELPGDGAFSGKINKVQLDLGPLFGTTKPGGADAVPRL